MNIDRYMLQEKIKIFIITKESELIKLKNDQRSLKRNRQEIIKKNIIRHAKLRKYAAEKISSGSIKLKEKYNNWNKEHSVEISFYLPEEFRPLDMPEDQVPEIQRIKTAIDKAQKDIELLNMTIGNKVDIPRSFNFQVYLC
jgi:hypothetical protein